MTVEKVVRRPWRSKWRRSPRTTAPRSWSPSGAPCKRARELRPIRRLSRVPEIGAGIQRVPGLRLRQPRPRTVRHYLQRLMRLDPPGGGCVA